MKNIDCSLAGCEKRTSLRERDAEDDRVARVQRLTNHLWRGSLLPLGREAVPKWPNRICLAPSC
ncbi:hypothetical protein EMIT0P100_150112 [Pseudomonas sp. IT-P100]